MKHFITNTNIVFTTPLRLNQSDTLYLNGVKGVTSDVCDEHNEIFTCC